PDGRQRRRYLRRDHGRSARRRACDSVVAAAAILRTRAGSYFATGATRTFGLRAREALFFSGGGSRSLFSSATIDRTNFFSPWSSKRIEMRSSSQMRTVPKPYRSCLTCCPVENVTIPISYHNRRGGSAAPRPKTNVT